MAPCGVAWPALNNACVAKNGSRERAGGWRGPRRLPEEAERAVREVERRLERLEAFLAECEAWAAGRLGRGGAARARCPRSG
jgi:glutathione S-transferase